MTRREKMLLEMEAFVPSWAKEYVRPAFEGDPEAARSLVFAAHDHQRARLALEAYRLKSHRLHFVSYYRMP